MASVRETADRAVLPRLDIIIVSAIPMNEFRNCSIIIGRSRLKRALSENRYPEPDLLNPL
jgi:hypothetical protein